MREVLKKNLQYSEKHDQKVTDPTIPAFLKNLIYKKGIKNIVDLGCGDGGIISAIDKEFLNKKITGIDISPRRIKNLRRKYPKYRFFCRDAVRTGLPSKHFDLAISTQVIEHLENDEALLNEVSRLLKLEGFFYISSVIKKPWAIYKYINKGKFVLDPTHEYEYKSKEEFLHLLKKHNFKIAKSGVSIVRRKFLGFEIPIPGFYTIEVLCKK